MTRPPLSGDLRITVEFTRTSSPHLWTATTPAFEGITGSGMTAPEACRSLFDVLVLATLRSVPAFQSAEPEDAP